MFQRVLIVEDHESANISVRKTLADLGIPGADYVYYCDDALSRIKKRKSQGQAYELMVTDLSFEEDEQPQAIRDGRALITAARGVQPDLKILVFSAESRAEIISELFEKIGVNGYVRKARRDAQELRSAMDAISNNKRHFPVHLRADIRHKNMHEFSPLDITIITLLSRGTMQKDIPVYLQSHQIRPSGLSSVEKRLSLMKEALGFSKNEQLVAFCKDKGIV